MLLLDAKMGFNSIMMKKKTKLSLNPRIEKAKKNKTQQKKGL
jgi:hypothetical protein